MKQKKILIVGPVPPPVGGISLYVKKLLDSKSIGNNYQLILFNTAILKGVRRFEKRNERSYLDFLSDGIIPGVRLVLNVLATFFSFTSFLRKKRPDVVHVFTSSFWGFWRNCTYILIAKFFKVKIIYHLLNAIDKFWNESSGVSKKLITMILNRSDIILVQSDGIKDFVEGISKTPVAAIYNGTDINFYDKNLKSNYTCPKEAKVLFIGGLSKNKGVFDILNAAQILRDTDIPFTFIGSGPVNEFLNHAKELGVLNKVHFTGRISEEEKVDLLKQSQIFVLPSYAEGQPVAILEAMAVGLPIISTTVGSIPEIVINEENGFLLEPGNVELLAKRIKELVHDLELYKRISRHNYYQARKLYDITRVFLEIGDVYKSL